MGQPPAQVFAQSGADSVGKRSRLLQSKIERLFAVGQPECFKRDLFSGCALTHEFEFTQVGHQHEAIPFPVAAYLIADGLRFRVFIRRLYLYHAAFRGLPLAGPAFLYLILGVEIQVGMARALVRRLHQATHLGFERRASGVQQVRQRRVGGTLIRRRARLPNPAEVSEECLDRRLQLTVRCRHSYDRVGSSSDSARRKTGLVLVEESRL